MTEEMVRAIFTLTPFAKDESLEFQKIPNEYSRDRSDTEPWWLVKTKFGTIKIGWRKRVINIDWTDTSYRMGIDAKWQYEFYKQPLTRDDVTSWDQGIHAWGYDKAVTYLNELHLRLGQCEYAASEEGKKDIAFRKKNYEAIELAEIEIEKEKLMRGIAEARTLLEEWRAAWKKAIEKLQKDTSDF